MEELLTKVKKHDYTLKRKSKKLGKLSNFWYICPSRPPLGGGFKKNKTVAYGKLKSVTWISPENHSVW